MHVMTDETAELPREGMDVLVRVASSHYRCHLGAGCEVSPSPPVTPVPGTPRWLTGLMLANEQVIPVVDLACVLGEPVPGSGAGDGEARQQGAETAPEPSAARLLTLRDAGLCVGFLVNDVQSGSDASLPSLDLTTVAGALTDRLQISLRSEALAS